MNPESCTTHAPAHHTLLAIVPGQTPDVHGWAQDLQPILDAGKKGRMERFTALAALRGVPVKTVIKKFYRFEKDGASGLIDRRDDPRLWASLRPVGLPEPDRQLVKQWCECWQRNSAAAIRALRRAWLEQRVPSQAAQRGLGVPHTTQPIDIRTGFPIGWSERNLMHYAPSEYELKAARIGRSAAADHRPLVYTTRRDLYVGQFLLWDDMWHDHEVVDLDQRKRGRPLEFHGLDLASAYKCAWGMRTRTLREDGTHEGLQGGDFRFLLAGYFATVGFNPRGTTLIVEHGTAAVDDVIERILSDATGGAITVRRGGMTGDPAHVGQYAGRAKGNFRFKAALESLGNLLHNEFAALPGQVGKDRNHTPEEMHDGGRLVDRDGKPTRTFGRQKHVDALLAALSLLPPERAAWLQFDLLTITQFRLIAEEVYGRINDRREHTLEGWDDRHVHDPRTNRMRRLSPREVWQPGRRALMPLGMETIALMLAAGDGMERLGRERSTRNGMIALQDGEISGDELRFDATGLRDRERYLTILNPFDSAKLFVFDASGGFAGVLPRIHSVSAADTDAIHRRVGAAMKTEAALLDGLRRRHAGQGLDRIAAAEANARVLRGEKEGASRMPDADDLAAVTDDGGAGWSPGTEADAQSADAIADQIEDIL